MRCNRRSVGVFLFILGIGMIIGSVLPYGGFIYGVLLVAVGSWQLFC